MAKKLTVQERILLAANELSKESDVFTAEQLVVAAWRRYRDQFGLQGFAREYPDSNRILTKIMGSGGLRGKGWLSKVGTKRYRVTEAGRLVALGLANSDATKSRERLTQLSRTLVGVLERMLNSRALAKHRDGEELTFSDVCSFWNISPRSTANQLVERSVEANIALTEAIQQTQRAGLTLSLPNGAGDIDLRVLEQLQDLISYLLERFATELDVIRGRTDERKYR